MKKTLLTFLSFIMLSSFMYSQCVPNTTFTGVLGLDAEAYEFVSETGDSLTALPHATVGDAYATFFDLRVPADTVIEYDLTGDGNPQLFDPVYLTSIGISEIQGLPMVLKVFRETCILDGFKPTGATLAGSKPWFPNGFLWFLEPYILPHTAWFPPTGAENH